MHVRMRECSHDWLHDRACIDEQVLACANKQTRISCSIKVHSCVVFDGLLVLGHIHTPFAPLHLQLGRLYSGPLEPRKKHERREKESDKIDGARFAVAGHCGPLPEDDEGSW